MKKTKLKVGDIVMVYKYQEDMTFGFTNRMREYIGKVCKVSKIKRSSESKKEWCFRLEPIGWDSNETNWNWSESVLKKLSKEEAFVELI